MATGTTIVNNEVFGGLQSTVKGAFRASKVKMQVSYSKGTPSEDVPSQLLIQDMAIQYQRPVAQVRDLTDPEGIFLIENFPAGSASFNRIVGPATIAANLLKILGDVSKAKDTTITLTFTIENSVDGSLQESEKKIVLYSPHAVSVGMSINLGQMLLVQSIALQFVRMEEIGDKVTEPTTTGKSDSLMSIGGIPTIGR